MMEDWNRRRRRSYDPLSDRYLTDYFRLPQVKTQLLKVGLMTKDGRILTDEEYKRAAIRRQQRWAARQQLARRMAMDARDKHLARQLELQKQLETVSRVELYRKMKGDTRQENLISIAPLELERTLSRSHSAPSYRIPQNGKTGTSMPPLVSPDRLFNSTEYHTDDDRPRSEGQSEDDKVQRKNMRMRYLKELDKYQVLHALDNLSLQRYDAYLRLQLNRLERARERPFTYEYQDDEITHLLTSVEPEAGLPEIPDRPIDSLYNYQGRMSSGRPRWRHLQLKTPRLASNEKNGSDTGRSTKRSRSESPNKEWKNKPVVSRLYITSAAAPNRRRRQPQTSCDCFLQYTGTEGKIVNNNVVENSLRKISITQQHCGGNTITVFTGDILPKAKIEFLSYRQRGYPFSLTVTEDDTTILRISTCCESRYAVGTKLGGKKGLFRWLGVKNAVPCYKCQMYRGLEAPYSNYTEKPVKRKKVAALAAPKAIRNSSVKAPRPPTPPKKRLVIKKTKNVEPITREMTDRISTVVVTASPAVNDVIVGGTFKEATSEDVEKNGTSTDEESSATEDESETASDSGSETGSEHDGKESRSSRPSSKGSLHSGRLKSRSLSASSTMTRSDMGEVEDSKMDGEREVNGEISGRKQSKTKSPENSIGITSSQLANDESDNEGSRSADGTIGEDKENDHEESTKQDHGDEESKSHEHSEELKSQANDHHSDHEDEDSKATSVAGKDDDDHESKDTGSSERSDGEEESQSSSKSTIRLSQHRNISEDNQSRTESISRRKSEESSGGEKQDNERGSRELKAAAIISQEREHGSELGPKNEMKTHHDAGVQASDGEESEEESETDGSNGDGSESEEGSDEDEHSINDRNGNKPLHASNENNELTERLKSASVAMLSAENGLREEDTSDGIGKDETEKEDGGPQVNQQVGDGTWYCSVCNFDNDPDMTKCRICGVARYEKPDPTDANVEEEPIGSDPPRRQDTSSWACRVCNFDNDPDLHQCRVCGIPRSSAESAATKERVDDEQGKETTEEEGKHTDTAMKVVKDDDEDTLADAESIRNETSEKHEMGSTHKRSTSEEGKMHLLGPPISIIPPSKSPSVMSDGETGESNEDENVGSNLQTGNNQVSMTSLNGTKERADITEGTETNSIKSSQITDTVFNKNVTSTDVSSTDQLITTTVLQDGMETDGTKEEAINATLREACSKEDVVISNTKLDKSMIEVITESLKQNGTIRSLKITNCHLDDHGMAAIGEAVVSMEGALIKKVDLSKNDLSASSVPWLVDMIRRYQIEGLLISGNKFGDVSMKELTEELSVQDCVKQLDVSENLMSHSSAESMGAYLRATNTLEDLRLGGNSNLDINDWKSIAQGFLGNEALHSIDLSACKMGDEGIEVVCMALKNNKKLKSINLEGNHVTDRGAVAVLDLVDSASNLVNVQWTDGNYVSAGAVDTVRQILSGRAST